MPRRARIFSTTGYLHVIIRGIGKQIIFEDRTDGFYFLKLLKKYSLETDVKISAYCLMENHVHLLVNAPDDRIIVFMKKLCVSYAGYFNKKYDRVGHVFQDRYKSEPIEDERYLLTVFRYILQNPYKAGICRPSDYPWSSYNLYKYPPKYMDLDLIKELVGTKDDYVKFISSDCNDCCLEFEPSSHNDNWALGVMKESLGVKSGTELQNYSKEKRDSAIRLLRKKGISVKQLERLTGISKTVIYKAK